MEINITGERIVLVSKKTFLRAIGISENPKDFKVQETWSEKFHMFLNDMGY